METSRFLLNASRRLLLPGRLTNVSSRAPVHTAAYFYSTEPIINKCVKEVAWQRSIGRSMLQYPMKSINRFYTMPAGDLKCEGTDVKNVGLEENGNILRIQWADGLETRFHSMWLRYNCRCGDCRLLTSNMCNLDIPNVPDGDLLDHATVSDDGNVMLSWSGDNHKGHIRLEFLRTNRYDEETLRKRYEDAKPTYLLGKELPVSTWADVEASDEGCFKWLNAIGEYGICLLKGVPTEKGYLKKVINKIGPVQTTIYGEFYDVVTQLTPISAAFSTNALVPHMDQVQYESMPGLQFLHCLRFDECVQGGETIFTDMLHVVEEFREKYPESFDTFVRVPATFERIHSARDHPVYMVTQRPHISVNGLGEVTAIRWSPVMQGPLAVKPEDVDPYYKAYQIFGNLIKNYPYKVPVRLRPGDVICFNNHRMSHSRNSFEESSDGIRVLQGGYLNIDEFKNTLNVLSLQVGPGRLPKCVLNHSWI